MLGHGTLVQCYLLAVLWNTSLGGTEEGVGVSEARAPSDAAYGLLRMGTCPGMHADSFPGVVICPQCGFLQGQLLPASLSTVGVGSCLVLEGLLCL